MEKGYEDEDGEDDDGLTPMPSSPRATRCLLSRDFI